MSSQTKIDANRTNAQQSTGPKNSVSYGLAATPNPRFACDIEAQSNFAQHIQKLRKDCLPEGTLEEETFRRYAFATFQLNRANFRPQTVAPTSQITPPGSRKWNAPSNSEHCRNSDLEVPGEVNAYGKEVTLSKVLPIADLRKQQLKKQNSSPKQSLNWRG